MKNRFCLIFLVLFLIDAILGIANGLLTLLQSEFFLFPIPNLVIGLYTYVIIIYSIAIIVIGFVKKLRWPIRILGICVISYTIITPVLTFLYGIHLGLKGISPSEVQIYILRSPFMNAYSILIGTIQFALFIWAVKDLSKGHYISSKKD